MGCIDLYDIDEFECVQCGLQIKLIEELSRCLYSFLHTYFTNRMNLSKQIFNFKANFSECLEICHRLYVIDV